MNDLAVKSADHALGDRSSGSPGQEDAFSPEFLAELAAGFQRMLAEYYPGWDASKIKEDTETAARIISKVRVLKGRPTESNLTRLLLGGDGNLAFSTATNVQYPKFELDVGVMIQKMHAPTIMPLDQPEGDPYEFLQSIGLPGGQPRPQASAPPQRQMTSRTSARASGGQQYVVETYESGKPVFPGGEDRVAFFGFGGSNDGREPWSYIVADAYSRLFFKGHPMDNRPLRIEPHISKIPLQIIDLTGRGKALIATRPIARGTPFLCEPPLLLALQKLDALTVANFERLTEPMHDKCAPAYDALHNCKPYSGPLVSRRYGILRTNGFKATFAENLGDRVFSAVMQIMSRANHSCAPNTSYSWDWKKYQATFTAVRDIPAGEEITVSYIDENKSKAERRKELKEKYFFKYDIARDELLAALEGFRPLRMLLGKQAPASFSPGSEDTETFVPMTAKLAVSKESTTKAMSAVLKDKPLPPSSNGINTKASTTTASAPTSLNASASTASTETNGPGKGTSGPKIQKIRPTDIAFPSANDFLDHSPNAPFKLDMRAMMNPEAPTQILADDPPDAEDTAAFSRLLKMRHKKASAVPGKYDTVCMFEFGRERSVRAFVISDPKTRQYLRAHPLFNTSLHVEPHTSQFAFRIADIPGCGKGLVATRLIKKGECILREPPLLVSTHAVHTDTMKSFHQTLDQYMHYRSLIALDSLANSHEAIEGVSPRIGIIRTNAIGVKLPTSDSPLAGTFELISRLNHSCDQNVTFQWSYKDFQGSIWSDRAIQPGEELTINYVDNPRAPKKVRQAELLKKFKVACTCKKCGPA
ncbi:SET domain-containing protein [Auricularia subglabra TFB-10046 SS5]|nr:SET domain-containing protein [Auricularia subglabra TFB-10046 SS5]